MRCMPFCMYVNLQWSTVYIIHALCQCVLFMGVHTNAHDAKLCWQKESETTWIASPWLNALFHFETSFTDAKNDNAELAAKDIHPTGKTSVMNSHTKSRKTILCFRLESAYNHFVVSGWSGSQRESWLEVNVLYLGGLFRSGSHLQIKMLSIRSQLLGHVFVFPS